MESKSEAKLNMYHAVIALCAANPAVVALVLAFSNCLTTLQALVLAIEAAAQQLEISSTGYAAAKKEAKKKLAQRGSMIAAQVFAYADTINDAVLRGSMNITYSKIWRAKDDEVQMICNNIYNTANGLLGSLGDYGITAGLLTQFQTEIGDYVAKKPAVRLTANQRKALLNTLNENIGKADLLLTNQMDKLSLNYIELDNSFKEAYDSAREIIDPGVYHTSMKLTVLHSITGEPVKGVKSYMDNSAVFKRSTSKGTVLYKNPPQGARRILLKHPKFKEVVMGAIPVSYGDKIEQSILMVPLVYAPEGPQSPVLLEVVVHIPAASVANVPYSFIMQGNYILIAANPATSQLVKIGFGPDENTIADPEEVVTGSTFQDTALNLGYSLTNQMLNIQNDEAGEAVVVLTIRKP